MSETRTDLPLLEIHLPHDPRAVQEFRKNFSLGAILAPFDSRFLLRTQVKVKICGPSNLPAPDLLAEVVYASPQGMGLQILNLTDHDRKIVEALLMGIEHPPAAPKPAPPAAPAPTPITASPRMNIPMEGILTCDLPMIINMIHHEGEPWVTGQGQVTFDLLFQLARNGLTGLLEVEEEKQKRTLIYFREGKVVSVQRTPTEETLTAAYFLRRKGKISEQLFRDALRHASNENVSDESFLAKQVPPTDLQLAIRHSIYPKLGHCFASKQQRYRIHPGPEYLAKIVPIGLNLFRAVFNGIMETAALYSTDHLLHALDPFMYQFVIRKSEPPLDPTLLKLDPPEQRFWDVSLKKPTRLRQLFTVSALSRLKSLRMLYGLYFLGLIEFTTKITLDEEMTVAHLESLYAELLTMNHFDALHIHWIALRPEIDKAYEETRSGWTALPVPEQHRAQCKVLIQKIIGRVDEAYGFLKDDHRRKTYRDGLVEEHRRKFSADLLKQHADMSLLRADFKQAKHYIEMALDLFPGNLEYLGILKQCKPSR